MDCLLCPVDSFFRCTCDRYPLSVYCSHLLGTWIDSLAIQSEFFVFTADAQKMPQTNTGDLSPNNPAMAPLSSENRKDSGGVSEQ